MADLGDHGLMGVDWEERIDFARMRRERLQRAKDALDSTDVDALFVFRTEDCRYLDGISFPSSPNGLARYGRLCTGKRKRALYLQHG